MLDWQELFGLTVNPLELLVRGTAMYWFLFLLFRCVLRRDVGAIGLADVLVLVVVADAAQNGMSGEYKSLTDGFILVATLVFWNVLLDVLSYYFPKIRRLVQPSTLLLVKDGQILERNLRREFLSRDELMAKLREQGVEKIDQVKRAYMEPHGAISVVLRKDNRGQRKGASTAEDGVPQ
jgi:uncharacterized membrane protein YcaP (DUF421 family)